MLDEVCCLCHGDTNFLAHCCCARSLLTFILCIFFHYQINRLLLEDDAVSDHSRSEYQSIITEFRAFLSDNKDVLDEATTMKLLERCFPFLILVFFRVA